MNFNEHRLQELREAIILLDGRNDTKELVEHLKEERNMILKTIENER